jgi:hypothetical protein
MRKFLTIAPTLFLLGCAAQLNRGPHTYNEADEQGVVTYYDRNQDGRIDYEIHDVGCCDRNWALVDTDYSGRYDLELRWGFSLMRRLIDVPVPKSWVPITAGHPPGEDR